MPDFVAILGPTASGKSALALRLAAAVGGEIVSADAFQVYRRFDIGTAKPSAQERSRVPHHLIDILEPHEEYSAGEFARRAAAAVADVRRRGRLPIVVGGSGLYLRALCTGLNPLPAVPPEVRARRRSQLEAEGLPALRRELERRDPVSAARLAPGDAQRTLRALELLDASGVPWSRWLAAAATERTVPSVLRIGLTLPRHLLYDRIGVRLREMVARGWVGEVEELLAGGLSPSLAAFRAIGYRQLGRHVGGETSLREALAQTALETRRYAKRQETWFRSEGGVHWLAGPEPALSDVVNLLEG